MTADLSVCRAFADAHPLDAARVFEQLPPADAAALLDMMPPATAAAVFGRMTPTAAAEHLLALRPDRSAALLHDLPTDTAAALLRQVAEPDRARLLDTSHGEEMAHLRRILRFPDGSAGSLMDPRALAVADDISSGEAMARIRRSPGHMLAYIYVVDRAHRLVGVLDLRELMLARPVDPVSSAMRTPVVSLSAYSGRSAIVSHPGWRSFHALPVVDDDGRLVGAIRYQTFRRLEDEARHPPRQGGGVATVFALGELYWLSLSGLLEGFAALAAGTRQARRIATEIDRGVE